MPPTSTPTPSGGGSTLVQDTFSRTVTGGWGSADIGGTWTESYIYGADASSTASVNGSQGVLTISTGSAGLIVVSFIGPSGGGDYDITATVNAGQASGAYLLVLGRVVNYNNFYAAQIGLSNNTFTIRKSVGGSWTTLGTGASPSPAFAANTNYNVRFQLSGTTLQARWWLTGTTEPTAWAVTVTDATFSAGQMGLGAVLTTSRSTGTYTFDNFVVTTSLLAASPLQTFWADVLNLLDRLH